MPTPDPFAEPSESAAEASLRHVTDDQPGIGRKRSGKGFKYLDAGGALLRDKVTIARIRTLAIPPAWVEVWICQSPSGHLQATGRDARGRKQYRYHPRWSQVRGAAKYGRLAAFGSALPKIRARVATDLGHRDLPREKVLAVVVQLLETTMMRIGNEEYARNNGTFGLSTLLDQHVVKSAGGVRIRFTGKSSKKHEIDIGKGRLARLVVRCREVPGQELFQYLDPEGEPHRITSTEVNEYIRTAAGEEFTAKDFRTWAGTLLATAAVTEATAVDRGAPVKITEIVKRVAAQLGNTAAICRKCYIHPAVLAMCEDETARERWAAVVGRRPTRKGLEPGEAALLRFLDEAD